MKTSEVLNKAADLIEERGWSTGSGWAGLDGSNDPLCAQGAIAAAMGVDNAVGWRCPAYHAVAEYIGIKSGLFSWNDHLLYVDGKPGHGFVGGSRKAATEHGRQQVIATLRAAAVIEAAREFASQPAPVAAASGAVV